MPFSCTHGKIKMSITVVQESESSQMSYKHGPKLVSIRTISKRTGRSFVNIQIEIGKQKRHVKVKEELEESKNPQRLTRVWAVFERTHAQRRRQRHARPKADRTNCARRTDEGRMEACSIFISVVRRFLALLLSLPTETVHG